MTLTIVRTRPEGLRQLPTAVRPVVDAAEVEAPAGYEVEPVLVGLSFRGRRRRWGSSAAARPSAAAANCSWPSSARTRRSIRPTGGRSPAARASSGSMSTPAAARSSSAIGAPGRPRQRLDRGLERPVDCKFHPDGQSLYVLDFGVTKVAPTHVVAYARTGVLWRVTRK